MLNFVDGDRNKPLHAAVQFGNIGAVKLCLEHGSSIDEISEKDQSSAVHVACAQGSLDIIHFMYEKQESLFLELLHSTDVNEMTPLHKAAMFGQIECASFLIEKGAFIDACDREGRTPLLLAASRSYIDMVCFLLKAGAATANKDQKSRNFLHLILESQITESMSSLQAVKQMPETFNFYATLDGFKNIYDIVGQVIKMFQLKIWKT